VLFSDEDQALYVKKCGRFIMFGGEKFDVVPFIHWNFVSFNKSRIEQAKDDWMNERFPKIPGDDKEFVPL
jgi:redox-sensitive bicupin YhaK (pirin superfamily)